MAVYDRWHLSHPQPGDQPCKCGRGKNKLYPTADHFKGKRWQVRWRDDLGRQPKRNFDERYGDDPDRHADAFDAKVTSELNAGTYVDPGLGKITLEEYAKQWRSGQVADFSSLETIDKHLAHIYNVARTDRTKRAEGLSPIGHRTLTALAKSPSAVQQWVKSLERKRLSPGYIKAISDTLTAIFNAAIDDGRIARNPLRAKSVKLPTIPDRQIIPWTREMVEAARAEVDRRQQSPAMVDLAAMAGLRESEVFGIAEEDIVFLGSDRQVRVRRQIKRARHPVTGAYVLYYDLPKYDKERSAPLSSVLSARLAEQIRRRPPVPVTLPWGAPDGKPRTYKLLFVAPEGAPWYRQSFSHTWNAARAAAGAPPPPDENGRFHGLRHTYASIELAAGADIRKLADWLGHTDPGFTLRTYIHFMPDTADVGRKAIDNFFSDQGASARDVPSREAE